MMRFSAATLALLAAIVSVCSGVLVGPVRLAHNKRYITYQLGASPENSTLECPVTLEDESEEVDTVSWVLFKDGKEAGSFQWRSNEDTIATGLLEGRVNIELDVGSLELTELHYDLNANYSCSVTLTNGDTAEAEQWELLIIDTTSNHVYSSGGSASECEYKSSFKSYAVYPKPTVRSGMYSATLGGYFDEVAAEEWQTTVYPNGSVAYYYNDRVFKIDQDTPADTKFISGIGVTKSDGTLIILITEIQYNTLWTKRGCPEIHLDEYQIEEYWSGDHTCRMEHTPGTMSVVCENGYHADGDVDILEFECKEGPNNTYEWRPPLANLGNLKCVINEGGRVSVSLPSLLVLLLSLLLARSLQ